jgi:hypothetical protein
MPSPMTCSGQASSPKGLFGEHGRARHLGVELCRGEASGERKRCTAHDETQPGSSCCEVNPSRGHEKRSGGEQAQLFGVAEIDEDADGEENGGSRATGGRTQLQEYG